MTKEELVEYCSGEFAGIKGVAAKISAHLSSRGIEKDSKKELGLEEGAAIGAFLFVAYSGMERVLEKVLTYDSLPIKDGEDKHTEILKKAFELGILPPDLYKALSRYLSFREFFSRSYLSDLNTERLFTLALNLEDTAGELEKEIFEYIESV
jgi:hypothetical protein